MRRFAFACVLASLLLASASFAADLSVTIVDPQQKPVARAVVSVYPARRTTPVAVQPTSPEGLAVFRNLASGEFELRVLAPGFAARTVTVALPHEGSVTVPLRVAAPGQTVNVTATRTPLPGEDAAADVSTLTGPQLGTLNPSEAAEAIRFLPGAVVNNAGRRGGLASLFVRGGDSRYNKILVDDVPVNDPGGTFNFGVVPLEQIDRLEFVRGAQSTLYGSDAMSSVIQMWTRSGTTPVPELTFGADGGNFLTGHGFASLSGLHGRFDYNLFADQFNTSGQGPNDDYSNAAQGANLGLLLSPKTFFRLRARHSNSRAGVQSFWDFNGLPLLVPELDEHTRQNDFLSSAELAVTAPARWQHRFTGFEYHHVRSDVDSVFDPRRASPLFGPFDFPFDSRADINRAGFDYLSEYQARSWSRTAFGYHFEDENGWVGDLLNPPLTHGLRRNHAVFGEQIMTLGRVSLIGGLRFEHNESFGNKAVPRVSASMVVRQGAQALGSTRLRFSYAEGIKAPRFEESFASGPFIIPNPTLQAEQNRSVEAGFQQNFARDKYVVNGTYFHNAFRNQIAFASDPVTFIGQYLNVNRALAHGAELDFHAAPMRRLTVDGGYTYTSTQILSAPFAFDPLLAEGRPLLRRPRHAGNLMVMWLGNKWGADLAGTFIGRRTDSDFMGLLPPVTYAAGYARVDLGAWRKLNSRMTAYVKVGNLLNRHYEEVAGYPALRTNFRAGMKFRVGGE